MMVDPAMIVEYIWPIVIITLAILLGQVIFGTGGVIFVGTAVESCHAMWLQSDPDW